MTPTKLLIGQFLLVLAIIVASIWIATQWAAAQLAYQPQLGPPWFIAFGLPIYRPWSIFPWWFSFDAYAPIIFDEAGAIAALGGFVSCGAAIFGLNDRQIELIARATPKRHYYLQSARGNRLFELGLGPIALALCGTSGPAAQARIDALLAEHGVTRFLEMFLRDAGLKWAAELGVSFSGDADRH